MAETDQRRAVLSAILNDPKSSPETLLRACELAERHDERAERSFEFEEWQRLTSMSDEALDAEVAALLVPLSTPPSFEGDAVFEAEVEWRAALLASEQTAALRRERHQLREALAAAEARVASPSSAKPSKAARTAPSVPDKPQKDAGAVVADLLAARERRWSDDPPRGPFGRGI